MLTAIMTAFAFLFAMFAEKLIWAALVYMALRGIVRLWERTAARLKAAVFGFVAPALLWGAGFYEAVKLNLYLFFIGTPVKA